MSRTIAHFGNRSGLAWCFAGSGITSLRPGGVPLAANGSRSLSASQSSKVAAGA